MLTNPDPNKQSEIELLILSACETARGDDRSTALTMNNFYENITQNNIKLNKANALRQSQLALINSVEFDCFYY